MKSAPFEATVTGINAVVIPPEIGKAFREKGHKRVLVKIMFNTTALEFYAALSRWKDGSYSIMLSKAKQKELGIHAPDHFLVRLMEDTSTYGAEMPEELEAVLESDVDAKRIFDSFTKGKQRGILYMIARYKTSQTKIDKSLLLCENLKRGVRNNNELLKFT